MADAWSDQIEPSRLMATLEKFRKFGFWMFVVAIPLNLIMMTVSAVVGILSTMGSFFVSRRMPARTPLDVALALYVAAIAMSLVTGRTDAVTFKTATSFWPVLVFYFSYYAAKDRLVTGETWVTVLLSVALVLSVYSLVQHFTGIDWFNTALGGPPKAYRHMLAGKAHRYVAVGRYDRHSNHAFAVMFFLSLALARALFSPAGSMMKRGAKWTACILFGLELLVTYVRAAWMGMAAGAVTIAGFKGKKWLGIVVIGGLSLLGGISLSSPSIESKLLATFDPNYPANRHRLFLWARSVEMFEDHPVFGIGWGNYQAVCPEYIDKVNPEFPFKFRSHNLFLNHLAETGIAGLLCLLYLFFRIFRVLVRNVAACREMIEPLQDRFAGPAMEAFTLNVAVMGAMVAFVLGSVTTDAYYNGDVSFVMWFLLGQAMGRVDALLAEPDNHKTR